MSKLLVVFGATSAQGSSVITTILGNSTLRNTYQIRALTRNLESASAQSLQKKGVEVVHFDPKSDQSLRSSVRDAHTVFLMTATDYHAPKEDEVVYGCKVADAAVAEKVHRFIFSTLPSPAIVSQGKYLGVDGFDAKSDIEKYIRTLAIKRAFYAPGTFMSNFTSGMKPRGGDDGAYSITGVATPATRYPLIDTAEDTGKYVAAILLDDSGKFDDKVLCCASQLLSMDEITKIYSQVTGKTVQYKQLPVEVMAKFLPNKRMADNLTQMTVYFQDFGYFGSETPSKVEEAQAAAVGKLSTFEEFLRREKPDLDKSAW